MKGIWFFDNWMLKRTDSLERSDISELVDRPVRIEIAMREAELFAIRNECEAYYACEPLPTLW